MRICKKNEENVERRGRSWFELSTSTRCLFSMFSMKSAVSQANISFKQNTFWPQDANTDIQYIHIFFSPVVGVKYHYAESYPEGYEI